MTTNTKNTAKRIRPGLYEYRGYTIVKQEVVYFEGDMCRNPWRFQMPHWNSHCSDTYTLTQAKKEIDHGMEILERRGPRSWNK
tara:strand:+ start:446 stop:694 length:249 start_codon:yes stop_codon:yes gene_type:complete